MSLTLNLCPVHSLLSAGPSLFIGVLRENFMDLNLNQIIYRVDPAMDQLPTSSAFLIHTSGCGVWEVQVLLKSNITSGIWEVQVLLKSNITSGVWEVQVLLKSNITSGVWEVQVLLKSNITSEVWEVQVLLKSNITSEVWEVQVLLKSNRTVQKFVGSFFYTLILLYVVHIRSTARLKASVVVKSSSLCLLHFCRFEELVEAILHHYYGLPEVSSGSHAPVYYWISALAVNTVRWSLGKCPEDRLGKCPEERVRNVPRG